jgi:hypothetical protein
MDVVAGLGIVDDRMPPVHGEQRPIRLEAGHRLV